MLPASPRDVRRIVPLDGPNGVPSRLANEFGPLPGAPVLESMDILAPAISVPRPGFVRTLVAPASVGSVPRPANNAPPSTPKPAHRIFGTTILVPLPSSTGRRANSVDRDNRSQCSVPSWRPDAVPVAKPEAVLDVV